MSSTARSETDADVGQRFVRDDDQPIVDAVQQIAEARGVPMAQVALAWVLHNPVVTAPIVGADQGRTTSRTPSPRSTCELTDDEVGRARGALHGAAAERVLTVGTLVYGRAHG